MESYLSPSDLPSFSKNSRKLIIENALLNWSEINPDIFGNMIQQVVGEKAMTIMADIIQCQKIFLKL